MVPEPDGMDSWSIIMLGLYQSAATKLGATNRCLADLRGNGVIR